MQLFHASILLQVCSYTLQLLSFHLTPKAKQQHTELSTVMHTLCKAEMEIANPHFKAMHQFPQNRVQNSSVFPQSESHFEDGNV